MSGVICFSCKASFGRSGSIVGWPGLPSQSLSPAPAILLMPAIGVLTVRYGQSLGKYVRLHQIPFVGKYHDWQ